MNSNRIKYSVNNVYINTFYQMPKFLVQNEEFEGLSYGAKFLYMLLKDRHELSLSNNWFDTDGNIFLIYTRKDMQDMMNVSNKTITKFMSELKKYNLIEEVQQGQGKPNLIYLLAVDIEITKTCKKYISKDVKSTSLEREKVHANNTNINKTDFSDNQSIYPEDTCPQEEISLTTDEEGIDRLIKKNIGYKELKNTYPEIEDVYNIMLDTFTSNKKTLTINKEQISISKVRDRFLSLNSLHIQYVLECVTKQDIKNMKSYLMTSLYNAPTTINTYYTNQVKKMMDNF